MAERQKDILEILKILESDETNITSCQFINMVFKKSDKILESKYKHELGNEIFDRVKYNRYTPEDELTCSRAVFNCRRFHKTMILDELSYINRLYWNLIRTRYIFCRGDGLYKKSNDKFK